MPNDFAVAASRRMSNSRDLSSVCTYIMDISILRMRSEKGERARCVCDVL